MKDVDFNTGDSFNLKTGGDGDNGEILMYLMDGFFERRLHEDRCYPEE